MVNLIKRAKSLRFYGLMGKRSGMEKLIRDKRKYEVIPTASVALLGLRKPFQVNRRK